MSQTQISDKTVTVVMIMIMMNVFHVQVLLKRQDRTENFSCNSWEFVSGFGDVSGEYWLGM